MNNRFMLLICLIATILLTLTGPLPAVYAKPGTGVPFQVLQDQIDALADAVSQSDKWITVDCTTGTISDALAAAPPGGRYIITVEGVCVEDVTITRDDVTVQGGSGEVEGRITIDGARRVVIDDLTVTGFLHGILALNNATVTVQNSIIEGNDLSGIAVRHGAFALIEYNTIENNGECEILASDSGHVEMFKNTIESNLPGDSCAAVGCFRGSTIRMRGENEVTQKASDGLALGLMHGSTFRQDGGFDKIKGTVNILNMTNAEFRNVEITGDIILNLNSALRLRVQGGPPRLTVTGDIIVNSESIADFRSSALIDGSVVCGRGFIPGGEVNRGFISRSPNLINSPPNNIINCFVTPPPPPPPPPP